MDQQQVYKTNALHAAVWPLGQPEKTYEIPLWQEICREWVTKFLQPTCVTHLIEELLTLSNEEDPESTAFDIRQAIEETGNWEEVCEAAGWRSCDEIISELDPGLPGSRLLLVKLINLALQGSATEVLDEDGARFYWVRHTPTWSEDRLVYTDELLPWVEMLDANATLRAGGDAIIEAAAGEFPTYSLERVADRHNSKFRPVPLQFSTADCIPGEILSCSKLEELPVTTFQPMSSLIRECRQSSIDWLTSEWLEPHGFVNFDQDDWAAEAQWPELGKTLGLEDKIARNEIASWYIVEEFSGEMLKELGEVIVSLPGSSNHLFGRDEGGQSLHMDGVIARAMIRSGYLDNIPPLGALNFDTPGFPSVRFTLGGDQFPLKLHGWSEHRPNRELDELLLKEDYREAGWEVTWGPEFTSETEGMIRTFKVGRKIHRELEPGPEFPG